MPRPATLYEWTRRVATRFPELPAATARVLAQYSFGLVLTHTCGLAAVALGLAALLGQVVNTVRRREGRAWAYPTRRGRLLRPAGPLGHRRVADKRVALALDATTLGTRYALRSWIEQGFKVIKRGGWQWQRTRMTDPARAERLWVVVSLATLWLVEVGGLAEFEPRSETVPPLGRVDRPRLHRLFRVGLAMIVAGLLRGEVRVGAFRPEPWPTPTPIPTLSEERFCSGLTYP